MRLAKVNSSRGAPMGRSAKHMTGLTDPLFELERVPLVDGAYDCGGAYWGSPDDLWCADFTTPLTSTVILHFFVRAPSREAAMEKVREMYPDAKFAKETGSVIEQTIAMLQAYVDNERTTGADKDDDPDYLLGVEEEIEELTRDLDRIRSL